MLGRTFGRSPRRTAGDDAVRDRLSLLGGPTGRRPDDGPPASDGGPGRHAARPIGSTARLRAGVSDRVPARLRGAMDGGFSGHHLGVLAVLIAVGLAITAWWVLSGRPDQQAVPPASFDPAPATVEPSASMSSSASATASASGERVIVDVTGKVRHPGIVTLPTGSRVVDALEAAGGARPGVDLADLNLARVLVDGEQILVGVAPAASWAVPTSPSASASVPTGVLDLNTADLALLETLPGIGPVTAQAILDWRSENGAFTSVDELLEVDGIGEVTLAEIRDLVTV